MLEDFYKFFFYGGGLCVTPKFFPLPIMQHGGYLNFVKNNKEVFTPLIINYNGLFSADILSIPLENSAVFDINGREESKKS